MLPVKVDKPATSKLPFKSEVPATVKVPSVLILPACEITALTVELPIVTVPPVTFNPSAIPTVSLNNELPDILARPVISKPAPPVIKPPA